ncbi:MAG: hypothetical protein WBD63_07135 [Phycisphaerae bacterium]|nr:hypothetical protein [Phycisphaerae bacterium]
MPTVACEPQRPSIAIRIVTVVVVVSIALGSGAIFWVIAWIVPRFAEIFAKFKIQEFPATTQTLCNIGLVVRQFWYLFGLVWLAATAGLIWCVIRIAHRGHLMLTVAIGLGSWVFFGLLIGLINILLFQPLVQVNQQTGHG